MNLLFLYFQLRRVLQWSYINILYNSTLRLKGDEGEKLIWNQPKPFYCVVSVKIFNVMHKIFISGCLVPWSCYFTPKHIVFCVWFVRNPMLWHTICVGLVMFVNVCMSLHSRSGPRSRVIVKNWSRIIKGYRVEISTKIATIEIIAFWRKKN